MDDILSLGMPFARTRESHRFTDKTTPTIMQHAISSIQEILYVIVLLTVEAIALVFLFRLVARHKGLLPSLRSAWRRLRPAAAPTPAETPQAEASAALVPTEPTADRTAPEGQSRKDFLRRVVEEMGGHCVEVDEDATRFLIGYQGGCFVMDFEEGSPWLHVWMPRIHEVPLDDIDKVSDTRKAINDENCNPYFWTLIYDIDAEDRKMNVHMASYFLLKPEMPAARILEAYMEGAFRRQRGFQLACERLKDEKAAKAQ